MRDTKKSSKSALAAGLIKQEDMGMALIARAAIKDAVDAYDAQAAPEQNGGTNRRSQDRR
jgi:hypothetical protein